MVELLTMYKNFAKRILDFIAAAMLLVLLSWLFLVLAVLVAARLGTPVIFSQERPGRIDPKTGRERLFTLYKFRTMTDARYSAGDGSEGGSENENVIMGGSGVRRKDDEEGIAGNVDKERSVAVGELRPDEERLTPFGRKLRATSLDELPELVNILKGDMSFVGPRPLLVKYLPRYSAEQARRHDVRPGLTGLAQVNGRNAITWEEKFAYDVRYVDELNFALDCHILAATFRAVVKREGIAAEGEATMPEFMGSGGDVD
jgi:lipopolysaccharide/colanic/teichoic acid biosynthesis glycosyltransferase